MPDNVSPGCTTYLAAGLAAGTDAAATLSVLARVTSVLLVVLVLLVLLVLLAMRWFAWAGRADPFMPTATKRMNRMLQASTTHADFVHIRTVVSLSFQGDQRRTLQVRTPETRTVRKERT
jgi:hypothetical protein